METTQEVARKPTFGGRKHVGGKKGARVPPQMLRDMRWAYKHAHDGEEGTPIQEDFRKDYRENRQKFLDCLSREERLYNQSGGKAVKQAAAVGASVGEAAVPAGPPALGPDEGIERCVGLVEGLLGEVSGEQ